MEPSGLCDDDNGGWNFFWQSQHFFISYVTNTAIRTLME